MIKELGVLHLLASTLYVVLCFSGAQGSDDFVVDSSTNFIKDSYGRTRFFHGVNEVEKGFPWYPNEVLNETRMSYFQEWGFNVVRLGTMWSGVNPARGVVNDTYLATMTKIVSQLRTYGIYSILDCHQDVLSSLFGEYDGAPLWLVNMSVPEKPYPWPLKLPVDSWFENYFTEACGHAFQDIYDNVNQSRDYFKDFWVSVMTAFQGVQGVLGVEIINEPWAGDVYANPELFLPEVAGATNLQPFYNEISGAIRQVDPNVLIFYEPVTWGVFVDNEYVNPGFNSVPGGDLYQNRSVLSYHRYCFLTDTVNHTELDPFYVRVWCDELATPTMFQAVNKVTQSLGGGSFMTEFGECSPDGSQDLSSIECEAMLNMADEYFQSWTYWDNGFFDEKGHINWNKVKYFSRPYATAVAGIPTSVNFQMKTAEFSFVYEIDMKVQAPTLIFIPPIHYPNGVHVEVSTNLAWVFSPDDNLISITVSLPSPQAIGNVFIYPA